ncbi:MAG TPA: hypothetical protein VGB17_01685, partial [Pyrinomonadaceae bacterium]
MKSRRPRSLASILLILSFVVAAFFVVPALALTLSTQTSTPATPSQFIPDAARSPQSDNPGRPSSFTANGKQDEAAARVSSLTATFGSNGVLVQWRTSFELDNLGFNLYREQQGHRAQVNSFLIAGSALSAGQGRALDAGRSYVWHDPQGTTDSVYYLESIALKGTTTIKGPVVPVQGNLKSGQAELEVLGTGNGEGQTIQLEGPAALTGSQPTPRQAASLDNQWAIAAQSSTKILVRKDGWYRLTQPELVAAGFDPSANADDLRLYVDGQEQPLLVRSTNGHLGAGDYIEFYGTGLDKTTTDTHVYWLASGAGPGQRINLVGDNRTASDNGKPAPPQPTRPAPDVQKGFDPNTSLLWRVFAPILIFKPDRDTTGPAAAPENLPEKKSREKEKREEPQPILYAETPQPLSANQSADQPSTQAAESLRQSGEQHEEQAIEQKRRRSNRRRAKKVKGPEMAHRSAAAVPQNFSYTVERKDRGTYFSSLLNGEKENYFGQVVATQPMSLPLVLRNIDMTSTSPAVIEVALQGASLQAHNVKILLNGTEVGTSNFYYRDNHVEAVPVSVSLLQEGNNTITLTTGGTSGDVTLLDYMRITFPHAYRADNDFLRFTLKANQTARVEGFTTQNLRLLDITNPQAIEEIIPTVEQSGAGYAINVGSGDGSKGRRTLIAFAANQFKQAAGVVLNQPSSLNQTGQSTDLLVISHRNFMQSIAPLVNLRRSQGLGVMVV